MNLAFSFSGHGRHRAAFCLVVPSVAFAAAAMLMGVTPTPAAAELLLYEPFDYLTGTASGSGVLLGGQSGGTGFAPGSSWTTSNTGDANSVTVYQQGNLSGVNLSTGVANTFTGTVPNISTSGGYFGSVTSQPGATARTTDHIYAWRSLDPAVTATFTAGSTTWMSFVSARAYNLNAAGPKVAIGAGPLTSTDRGHTAQGEAIGMGGGLGTTGNTLRVSGQFWDQQVAGIGSFQNYDATGLQAAANNTTKALNTDPAVDPLQAFTWAQELDAQPIANILITKITWSDTGPDAIQVARFLPSDGPLTESMFNASALPSSTTWSVQPDLAQSTFNTISIAGSRYFADEFRIATTFASVAPAAVPEPGTATAFLAALAAATAVARLRGWGSRKTACH